MSNVSLSVLSLQHFDDVGPDAIREHAASVSNADLLSFDALAHSPNAHIKEAVASERLTPASWSSALEHAKNELARCESLDIHVLTFLDDAYPQNLIAQPHFPLVLYAKGDVSILNNDRMVAIVGTRQATPFGVKMNQRISAHFYDEGYTVVSGLAKGHDAIAHQTGVDATGKTFAILAHGLDQPVYPKENRPLAQAILDNGGILCGTYPLGTKLEPRFLVERDEWQVSISDGVIAMESSIRGGTNHAINHALKQHKPIGMLDHRAYKKLSLADIEQTPSIQGNIHRIDNRDVLPLFNLNSIRHIDFKMRG